MNRKKRGFTLIELLTVMSIMGMLTTIAVTSYFSAIRGMARRSALKHLADTMVSARQRACMEPTWSASSSDGLPAFPETIPGCPDRIC